MTNPSHLKVKRLVELDRLPAISGSWTYAVRDNKDYKVELNDLVEGIGEGVLDEVVEAVGGPDGGGLVGWERDFLAAYEPTIAGYLNTTAVNVLEYAHLVTDKPSPNDQSTWDWTPAVAAAVGAMTSGSTLQFPAGATIRCGLVEVANKAITIDLNHATIVATDPDGLFHFAHAHDDVKDVTSISDDVHAYNDTGATLSVTKLTIPSHGLAEGDIIKVAGSNAMPWSPTFDTDSRYRYGEHAVVWDVAGDDVWLGHRLIEPITDDVIVSRLDTTTPVVIKNGRIVGDDGIYNSAFPGYFVHILGRFMPRVSDVTFEHLPNKALVFEGCFGFMAENVYGNDIRDAVDTGNYGYVCSDTASSWGRVINIGGRDVRHIFTTNGAAVPVGSEAIYKYGRAMHGTVVLAAGASTTAAPFDLHEETYDYSYIYGNNMGTAPKGNSAAGSAFHFRGEKIKLVGLVSRSGLGITISPASGQTDDLDYQIVDCDVLATDGPALGVYNNNPTRKYNIRVVRSRLRSQRAAFDGVITIRGANVQLEDTELVVSGNSVSAANAGLSSVSNASLSFRRCAFDMSGIINVTSAPLNVFRELPSATLPSDITFDAQCTGNVGSAVYFFRGNSLASTLTLYGAYVGDTAYTAITTSTTGLIKHSYTMNNRHSGVATVSTTRTLDRNMRFVRADASGGNITISLPLASTLDVEAGTRVIIRRVDSTSANTVTITCTRTPASWEGTEASFLLPVGAGVEYVWDGGGDQGTWATDPGRWVRT